MKKYETYKCSKCGTTIEIQNPKTKKIIKCCELEMNNITDNLTAVNLMKAFSGESQARNKYEFFAEIAQKEGWHSIAKHFYEAAENEKYHAKKELEMYNKLIYGMDMYETLKNLDIAIDGENYEHEIMYPEFAKIAEEEGYKDISRIFKAIAKVEVEHEREYNELKQKLIEEGFFESKEEEYWVCEICGHVHRGKKAPNKCPLCKADKEYFKREQLY
jgi:rubrerythrin